eukprot:COSAG06_NODE_19407_length_840_cov_0.802969_2_plen_118_part_01
MVLAEQVDRRERGIRRKSFTMLKLKAGVVAGRIVPKEPASFLGKVTLESLRTYVLVEQQLRLRGIGGWTPNKVGRQPGGPPLLNVKQLQELLRPYTEEEEVKTGKGNETKQVTYLKQI